MKQESKIYLVGAGPGDESLITVKGLQLIQSADIIVYDYLVNPNLLENASTSCEKIYVGKKAGAHSLQQEEINELLIQLTHQYKTIVRLKGGDPFVFGRGGEEALALKNANIKFEVVPGVTSGIAVPAYSGIPVTHRNLATSMTFVTGHESDEKNSSQINWKALAQLEGTLVFYMGVKNIQNICNELMTNGKNGETPVAIMRMGTYPQQEEIIGNLENMAQLVEKANFQPPALIIVGEVVNLHQQLSWRPEYPLEGKRYIVTRSRQQASKLSKKLKDLGAEVVELPTIEIKRNEDFEAIDQLINNINDFQWLIFNSTNAIHYFFQRLHELKLDVRKLSNCQIIAIGSESELELKKEGIIADFVPSLFTSEGIIELIEQINIDFTNQKVAIPGSNLTSPTLQNYLTNKGAQVFHPITYINQKVTYEASTLQEIFSKPIDAVTFTSSSTVQNLVELLIEHKQIHLLKQLKAISIGPVTTATLIHNQFEIIAQAETFTIDGIVEAMLKVNR